MWIIWSLAIYLLEIGSSNAEVKQPWSLVLPEGESASLTCSQNNDHLQMLWYRQDRGQGLQLLYSFYNKKEQEKGTVPDRFTTEQPQEKQCILNISSAELGDSAVYFCASSPQAFSGEKLHFGQGTRLTVLEKGQKTSPPEVTIFAPSAQEVEDKQKATIVCLATDFFPDHVSITWFMNGEARTEGVKTDTPELDKTKKKYSLVSRLRITKKEWQDSSNKFKCRIEFYDENGESHYEDEISGVECGGSAEAKETYLRRANVGKLVYILLIFKSFLYGAFVMSLKLQKKVAP